MRQKTIVEFNQESFDKALEKANREGWVLVPETFQVQYSKAQSSLSQTGMTSTFVMAAILQLDAPL